MRVRLPLGVRKQSVGTQASAWDGRIVMPPAKPKPVKQEQISAADKAAKIRIIRKKRAKDGR